MGASQAPRALVFEPCRACVNYFQRHKGYAMSSQVLNQLAQPNCLAQNSLPAISVGASASGLIVAPIVDSFRRPATSSPLVSVIVPLFNEAGTIAQVLAAIDGLPFSKEIIVVDDGSTDASQLVARSYVGGSPFTVLQHDVNLGKGAAVRTGLRQARGEYVVIQDADLEYSPNDLPQLIEVLQQGRADCVYGVRATQMGFAARLRRLPNAAAILVLNGLVRLIFGHSIGDEATCYKIFKREALLRMELESNRFELCPEMTGKALRLGLTIAERPVCYRPRTVADGKKIRMADFWTALKALYKYRRWSPRPVMEADHA